MNVERVWRADENWDEIICRGNGTSWRMHRRRHTLAGNCGVAIIE